MECLGEWWNTLESGGIPWRVVALHLPSLSLEDVGASPSLPEASTSTTVFNEAMSLSDDEFLPPFLDEERGFVPWSTEKIEEDEELSELLAALNSDRIQAMIERRPVLLSQAQAKLRIQNLQSKMFVVYVCIRYPIC